MTVDIINTRAKFDLFIEINGENIPIKVNLKIKSELESNFVVNDGEKIKISNDFFIPNIAIQNVYRYSLKRENGLFKLQCLDFYDEDFKESKFKDQKISYKNELPCILLILESPHKDEFNYNTETIIPISPAQGKTGEQIEKKLDLIINSNSSLFNSLSEKEYRVIIVNPIPFQTSLHFCHKQTLKGVYKTLRDNVWKTLWNNDNSYRKNLIDILLHLKPVYVLNCCTKEVSSLVSESIEDYCENLYSLNHPSSWVYIKENNIGDKLKINNEKVLKRVR